MLRFFANIVLFLAILYTPWWFFFPLAVLWIFLFRYFYEGVLWMIIADLLYGIPLAQFYHFPFLLSTAALLLFSLFEVVKKYLRFSYVY